MFKTIITAALCALILASTTAPGFAQDASPLPSYSDVQQACREQAITEDAQHSADVEARLTKKGTIPVSNISDADRLNSARYFLDAGDYFMLVRVAKCLASKKHYDEAVAMMKPIVGYYREDGGAGGIIDAHAVNYASYEAWHDYALILDAKGDRKGAGHAITIAYNLAKDQYMDKALEPDYRRLAAANIASAEAQQRKADAADLAIRVAKSRRFWDACSADQRHILVLKGGEHTNRDHNVGENWGPNRIQTYDAANYHQETWWYYGLQGKGSAEAFTFHNGHLVSHYQA